MFDFLILIVLGEMQLKRFIHEMVMKFLHHSVRKVDGFLFLLVVGFLPHCVIAQIQNVYCVQFNSKSSNLFLPANNFLSAKAIERRQKQNIAIVENDFPVYEPYKQAVAAMADSVIHTLKWFNAITIVLSDSSKLPQIRNLNFVKQVQKLNVTPVANKTANDKLNFELYQTTQMAINSNYGTAQNQTEMLHLDRLHNKGFVGANLLIAVFDNGFKNVDTISAFRHLFQNNQLVFAYNFVERKQDVFDEGSHGTSVLSCIAANVAGKFVGTAPMASIALFKTEDNNSETILEEFHWAEAAEKADSLGADIFSTSLGYNTFNNDFANHTYFDMDGNKTVITQASNIAFSKGILVVTSAGNEGAKPWKFITAPADGKDVLAIGAVDANKEIASFSSRGPSASGIIKPDVCAQGANVAILDVLGNPSISGGTSFSCPIIAGSAACLWQSAPQLSVIQIKNAIIESAHLFANPNNDYGYGIPNFYKAMLEVGKEKTLLENVGNSIVFPNPSNNRFSMLLKTNIQTEANISIADLTGKIVFKANLPVFENDVQLLELEESQFWSAGNYFVKIEMQGNKTIHKIVKTDL